MSRRRRRKRYDDRHRRLGGFTAQADGVHPGAAAHRGHRSDRGHLRRSRPRSAVLGGQGQARLLRLRVVGLPPTVLRPVVRQARTTGAIESREMDEGMLRCGLQAAAQRLPFLPIRAGLGSDVRAFWGDELKTVKSPYPTGDGYEELVAMPALNLDVALVHLNLGDAQGNAAYTGIDPLLRRPVPDVGAEAADVGREGGIDRRAREIGSPRRLCWSTG